jgi:DNA-binding LacI/PurR family transcriptional regulator
MPQKGSNVKRPTILDVAERAGVSKSLVSLVMRDPDRVSDASREAVLKAADELGYRPNAVARSLVQQRTHVIGVVLADLHNPFYADVADGIEAEAAAAGFRTMISSGFLDPAREKASVETLLELRVDALISTGSMMEISDLEEAAKSVPVTVVGRYTDSPAIDMVGVDDAAGAREAVEYLIALGHRNIVHIHAGTFAGAPGRRTGYEEAMRAGGLGENIRSFPGAFTEAGGAKAMADILNSRDVPTAVFAPNDAAALGAMDVIDSAGLAIPDDISLIGYDNLGIAGLPRISLTTVGQPRARLGEDAVRLILERLQHNRTVASHVVVPPSLVVRATTGPPRRGG